MSHKQPDSSFQNLKCNSFSQPLINFCWGMVKQSQLFACRTYHLLYLLKPFSYCCVFIYLFMQFALCKLSISSLTARYAGVFQHQDFARGADHTNNYTGIPIGGVSSQKLIGKNCVSVINITVWLTCICIFAVNILLFYSALHAVSVQQEHICSLTAVFK